MSIFAICYIFVGLFIIIFLLTKIFRKAFISYSRKFLADNGIDSFEWPIAFHTIDVAIEAPDKTYLFGRKPGKTTWQFIGGFVDPIDDSAAESATRELGEETSIQIPIEQSRRMKYIGSYKINDSRYVKSRNKVITSFYKVSITSVEAVQAKASDDIEEVKFFKLGEMKDIIAIQHKELLSELLMYNLNNE